MICALVLLLAVPAEALGGQSGIVFNLDEFFSYSDTLSDVDYLYYTFSSEFGYWLINKNGSYSGLSTDTGNSLTFSPGAGNYDYFEFYYYFLGGNYGSNGEIMVKKVLLCLCLCCALVIGMACPVFAAGVSDLELFSRPSLIGSGTTCTMCNGVPWRV